MAWFDSNWQYRKKITVDNTKVSATLTDYPLYVDLSDLGSDFFSNVKSDGSDIVITAADETTKLSRELVNINTGAETGQLHFKAPSLSGSVDTDYYIYYGYSSAAETNDTATWTSDYRMVQHLEESSGTLVDSTSNSNNGTNSGATYGATGQIEKGMSFDDSNDTISVADHSSLDITGNLTLSSWVNVTSTSVYGGIITKYTSAGNQRGYYLGTNNGQTNPIFLLSNDGVGSPVFLISPNALSAGLHKVTATYDGSTAAILVDGVLDTSVAYSSGIFSNSSTARLGSKGDPADFFGGVIDEARIKAAATTIQWELTEYNNQKTPSTFYAIGSQEQDITAPIVSTTGFSLVEENTATVSGNVTSDGGSAITERGVAYGTSPNPTTPTEVVAGTTGTFDANLTGLTEGELYYARAYAINAIGTSYGADVSFSTKPFGAAGLNSVEIHNRNIILDWTKGSGSEKTEIRRKEGSFPTDPADGDQAYFDTGTTVDDTGLTANTSYFYRAWAWDEGSGYSDDYVSLNVSTLQEYLLTANISPVASGSVVQNPTGIGGIHEAGEVVEVTATPTGDFNFWFWEGDLTGIINPETIVMSSNKTITANFTLADFIFQENASLPQAINISQSQLIERRNSSDSIKFSVGTDFPIPKNVVAEYYDQDGNLIFDGKIRGSRELSKSINTDDRILEIEIYDRGYNLIDGELNEIYRDISPEDLIEDVVTDNGLIFINDLPSPSGIIIPKKKYIDRDPIEAVNEVSDTLGANWRMDGFEFHLYRRGNGLSPETIDGNGKWALSKEGWKDEMDKQATKVIVKGATILQRTREVVTGTGTTFILSRTPVDVEITGFTQTTENIVGDYTVDKEQKTIEFNSSQTDPEIFFSYESQIRVEIGDGDIVRVVEKSYIEDVVQARKFGRKYIEIFGDGIQTSKWLATDIYGIDIRDLTVGDNIPVLNKLNPDRNGQYVITKVVRKYPRSIEVTVGEDESSLYNWQSETKDRVKQLEAKDENSDFTQKDVFKTGSVKVNVSAQLTKLFIAIDTGDVLWASDTPLASDGDLISDTGPDEDYSIAYDDGSLPPGSVIDLLAP